MSEGDRRQLDGTQADAKPVPVSLSATIAAGTVTSGFAATVFWLLGCAKGHQWYYPDDALVYFWIGLAAPAGHVMYKRFNSWVGVEQ